MLTQLIGLIAATLTTAAFLPQAIKTWRTKSTGDLSPFMFLIMCTGVLLWLIYGLLIKNTPIILANSVTICLASIILFFIVRPDRTQKIKHIAIWVNDIEQMKDFYINNFKATAGKKYYNRKKGFQSYFLSLSSGTQIELMNRDNIKVHESKNHFAISVGSAQMVDILTNTFKQNGINVISWPRLTGDGYYESMIEDIEGNLVEITI